VIKVCKVDGHLSWINKQTETKTLYKISKRLQ